jgi:hypothetical protein
MKSLRPTLILLTLSIVILLAATATSAQSAESSASSIPKTANVADDLKDCTQMLDQTLDELKALKAYVVSLEKKAAVDDAIEKKQGETIDQQGKLIAIYEKKRGTTISFFFGLVKIKKN